MQIGTYILRRLLLIVPALFGISLFTFLLINLAPGGPVDQKIEQIRFGSHAGRTGLSTRGQHAVSQTVIDSLKRQYGFDKPLIVRYGIWIKNISHLDFGESLVYGQPVLTVIAARFPVSLQFGVISFALSYIFAVSFGFLMARHENSITDRALGAFLLIANAIPPFAVAVLLLVFFAGGSFFSLFPLGYLESSNYQDLTFWGKIWDRVHHFILPLIAYMMGSFAGLTFLFRSSVLQEIRKDYVRFARAMGVSEKWIYAKHVLRNALVPMVTGMGGFLAVFFSGSLLVETIFQLDGIGMLGFNALMARDYNVIMGMTFLQSLALLLGNLISDLLNILVDPRIHYAKG